MNRTDLEYIRGFDATATAQWSIGLFIFSGALWMLIEETIKHDFVVSSVGAVYWAFCMPMIICGVVLMGFGAREHRKRINHIDRIFEETKRYRETVPAHNTEPST